MSFHPFFQPTVQSDFSTVNIYLTVNFSDGSQNYFGSTGAASTTLQFNYNMIFFYAYQLGRTTCRIQYSEDCSC